MHSDTPDTWYTMAHTTHINLLADSSFVEVKMPRKKKERKIGISDEEIMEKAVQIVLDGEGGCWKVVKYNLSMRTVAR